MKGRIKAYEEKEVDDHGKIMIVPMLVVELASIENEEIPIGQEIEIIKCSK